MTESVFAGARDKVWEHRFGASLEVYNLTGGIPNDPKVATGWLKSRLLGKEGRDDHLADLVSKTMAERGIKNEAEAIEATSVKVNGFKRSPKGLLAEGRCLKALLKESFNVAMGGGHLRKDKWGATGKGLTSFVAEHVMVPEVFVPILDEQGHHVSAPDRINQRFVSTWRGQGITYEEVVNVAVVNFTVLSDWDFGDEVWETVWVIGEQNGFGSTRSQGSGRFNVVRWEKLTGLPPRRRRNSAA